jgi:Protein of unknown function (DUF2934)
MIPMVQRAGGDYAPRMIFQNQLDSSPPAHPPSLDEIQVRAYRIHRKHGAVYGGYSLDEWLEAEHELDEELQSDLGKKEQAHE